MTQTAHHFVSSNPARVGWGEERTPTSFASTHASVGVRMRSPQPTRSSFLRRRESSSTFRFRRKCFHSPAVSTLLLASPKSRLKARHRARCFDSPPANQNPLCFSAPRRRRFSTYPSIHGLGFRNLNVLACPDARIKQKDRGIAVELSLDLAPPLSAGGLARAAREAWRRVWILFGDFLLSIQEKVTRSTQSSGSSVLSKSGATNKNQQCEDSRCVG